MRRHPWVTAAIAVFLLCAILFFCVEWRVEKRWQRYAAEARARGVKLYLAEFAPPEIPDDQNFAALPMLQKAFAGGNGSGPFKLPKRSRPATAKPGSQAYDINPPGLRHPRNGEKFDWVEWQTYFKDVGFLSETSENAPADVLRALEHYAPQFQEWSEWRTTRPKCRPPINPHTGRTASAYAYLDASIIFDLRMCAHLAVGESAAACVDLQDALQASRAERSTPGLLSSVLRVGMRQFLLQGVGDGLRERAWAGRELKTIESELGAIRLWEEYGEALAFSRAEADTEIEKIMNMPFRKRVQAFDWARSSRKSYIYQLMPRSLFRANELRVNLYIDELTKPRAAANQTFDSDRQTPSSPANLRSTDDKDYYFLCDMMGAAYSIVEGQSIRLQTLLDETRLACALERFRLARGAYPESLAALVPEFIGELPIDIYGGAPYRYRREGASSFQLYGVGENRTDDGGQISPSAPAQKQADAIWLYAPPAVP